MLDQNAFLEKLMARAREEGLEACEAYVVEDDSFGVMSTEGEVVEYKSNLCRGLGLRGLKNGRMGYASTEAFDEEAVEQLIQGVLESAELCEDPDPEMLYDGSEPAPTLDLCDPAMGGISAQAKIDMLLAMEKTIKAYDQRIDKTAHNSLDTGRVSVRIVNSYGMDRSFTQDYCDLAGFATARDGAFVSTGFEGVVSHRYADLDPQRIGREAAQAAVDALNAKPVPSGRYRVVLSNKTMTQFMNAFCGIFSAETAQKGLSLLSGKLGQTVAAPCVTLTDDPLLPDGLASRPFDAEGVPSKAHTLVDAGVFVTFLHNLKTARKDGVTTTGNASRGGYAGNVHVSPTNLFFQPGSRSLEEILSDIGDGLVITEVEGLHAGANAVSGDFSLLSKGYAFHDGKRSQAVEQITVAGNFYEMLKNIRELASDLRFPFGGMGSPSVDVGELSVSGS